MPDDVLYDPEDGESHITASPGLTKVFPNLTETEAYSISVATRAPRHIRKKIRQGRDEGDQVLLGKLAGLLPQFGADLFNNRSDASDCDSSEMSDQSEAGDIARHVSSTGGSGASGDVAAHADYGSETHGSVVDATVLKQKANAVLDQNEVEYAQTSLPRRPGRDSPALKVNTKHACPPVNDDTITSSPTLRKHVITMADGAFETLPALQPTSPVKERVPISPQTEKLPSLRQVTGQMPLSELAELATQQDPRYPHNYSHSMPPAGSPPSAHAYYPYRDSAQTSPCTYYTLSARSPTSTIGEQPYYGSPTQPPTSAYFAQRRTSASAENTLPPPLPTSLTSTSSSGESHATHNSSSTEGGYSTAHTTPMETGPSVDGTPRPVTMLPPPPGMPQSALVLPGFKCEFPGCNAVPFQTQYLLSSHKNVHSSNRPHYCQEKGCPRGEGGKGFKRKNEMIRHGLVHSSPGYVCPYCPDRDHKYPRPDNLQRHVRAHHVDKDRDDPQLREVLARQVQGTTGKARRRRANTNGSV